MRKALAMILVAAIASIGPAGEALASTSAMSPQEQEEDWQVQFSSDQLENLLAPIALYPDPLLAQVLLAATFPDQIDEAARMLRAYGVNYNVDETDWDVSVKSVAHYPTVLSMMADKIDWTTSVGQAYVNQSTDVMDAIQRLREQARSMGNLDTTTQQEIVETDGYIYIYPAQESYIYVPVYDPAIVYFRRPVLYARPLIWFGAGLAIGAWLNHDCDWREHRVFYHGWGRGGPAWIERSRPHVRITNIYINNTYRNVRINHNVIHRNVNYDALNRYNNIHRDTSFDNVRRQRGGAGPAQQRPPADARRDNKIIRRNIDPRDPRIDANRGRDHQPGGRPEAMRPQDSPRPITRPPENPPSGMRPPDAPRPITRPPDGPPSGMRPPDAPRPVTRPPDGPPSGMRPPDAPRPVTRPPDGPPSGMRPPDAPRPVIRPREVPQPGMQPPERPRPVTPREMPRPQDTRRPEQIRPAQQPPVQSSPPSVFRGGGAATIDPRAAGQRGQESRQQPVATPRPAPAPRTVNPPPPAPAQRGGTPPPRPQERGRDRRPQ